jgi:hypothetical protein
MHVDKALGPDGFNGLFLKKCWPIVKHDFYNLYRDFFDCRANIEGTNKSFITLIPKTSNPETVSHLFFQRKPSANLYACQDQVSCI